MEARIMAAVLVGELLIAGAFYLILPRIARRGLLFGAYVGEEAAGGEPARRITRAWYRGMTAWLAVCLAGAIWGLSRPQPSPALAVVPVFLLLAGFFALYLRAYRAALRLAPSDGAVPPAVAVLEDDPRAGTLGPVLAIALAIGAGLGSLAYAVAVYPRLPETLPTHFGLSGTPDGWSPKSWAAVLTPSLLGLVMGTWISLIALFTAHAKRALRADGGASLAAQNAFRGAMTRFLTAIAVLVTAMTALLNVSMLRVALGMSERLSPLVMVAVGLLLVVALGGSLVLALRYGQGGARLEARSAAAGAPLTDGLADNRHWKLGMFYVNREDPSILVEHRFGLGYTLNFGNVRALVLFGGGLLALLVLLVVALVTS